MNKISCPLPPTLRNPSDCSVLSHSLNTAYLATVLRTSAQIPLRGTSDTLRTLSDIRRLGSKSSQGGILVCDILFMLPKL